MVNRAALIDQIQEARKTPRKGADPPLIGTRRARPICLSSLSGPEGVPTDVRNLRKIRQANRAACPLDAPDCRKIGLQGRFSQMGRNCSVWRKGPAYRPTN